MPSHSHALVNGVAKVEVYTTNNGDTSNESSNGDNALGTGGTMPDIYRENPTALDHVAGANISGSTNLSGGSQSFNIRNPFLGINVCIALTGVYPSRN